MRRRAAAKRRPDASASLIPRAALSRTPSCSQRAARGLIASAGEVLRRRLRDFDSGLRLRRSGSDSVLRLRPYVADFGPPLSRRVFAERSGGCVLSERTRVEEDLFFAVRALPGPGGARGLVFLRSVCARAPGSLSRAPLRPHPPPIARKAHRHRWKVFVRAGAVRLAVRRRVSAKTGRQGAGAQTRPQADGSIIEKRRWRSRRAPGFDPRKPRPNPHSRAPGAFATSSKVPSAWGSNMRARASPCRPVFAAAAQCFAGRPRPSLGVG